MSFVNEDAVRQAALGWQSQSPFPHFVIDNFFDDVTARTLEAEFPEFSSEIWHSYGNAIEVKKVCNNWNLFPSTTYQVFEYLNSSAFVDFLSTELFKNLPLYSDSGLNGGGWHIHSRGGKLNTHLDYSLHPKLLRQRKLNIIVYLNSNWDTAWGGSLGLWGNESADAPGELVKTIEPLFNRAVVFDTTCNSWHGLPDPLICPETEFRKSLAVYYLTDAPSDVDQRGKALFAPTNEQEGDDSVLELIRKRSDVTTAASVYSGD